MHCIYCKKPVFGNDGMTVSGGAPAHYPCFQANQVLIRTFQHLEVSALNDEELQELKELVIAEENSRNRTSTDDGIELF